jgi:hypothetical protein
VLLRIDAEVYSIQFTRMESPMLDCRGAIASFLIVYTLMRLFRPGQLARADQGL